MITYRPKFSGLDFGNRRVLGDFSLKVLVWAWKHFADREDRNKRGGDFVLVI